MKLTKTLSALLALAILCCFGAQAEITLNDQAGNTVVLEAPAEKIVSCYYIFTTGLLGLNCKDRLVGVEAKADTRGLYRLAAPELLDLPAVGSGKGVNLEAVLELDPDLVLLPLKLAEDAERLTEMGVPTLILVPESEQALAECITILGAATGCETRAEEILSLCEQITAEVAEKVNGAERPRVYMASESSVLTTYPAGLYQHDLIEQAGGVNVAAEVEGASKVNIDPEQLINWDPEYLFIVAGASYTVDDVLNDPQLASVTAVKNGNVFAMPDNIESWDYPTVSSVLGKLYLASVLHPDLVPAEELTAQAAAFYGTVFGFEPDEETLFGAEK